MAAIDWTKIYKKYKGKWVALKDDEVTVIAHATTAKAVMKKAQRKGFAKPILTRVPVKLVTIVGLCSR